MTTVTPGNSGEAGTGRAPSVVVPSPSIASGTWDARALRLAGVLVAFGIALRLIRYLANRSLWLDEAMLAESLLTYTARQLATEPLLHWQAAPLGFLALERLAVTLVGTSEYALRLVPLVAGVTSVAMMRALVTRTLAPAGGLVALAIFAGLEPLVYYSGEVKQYAVDVAVCLGILLGATKVWDRPARGAPLAGLGAGGAVGLLLSHPAVFVLAGAGLVLLAGLWRAGRTRAAVAVASIGAIWAGIFVANYVLFPRPLARHPGLAAYWSAGYMPHDVSAAPWLARSLYRVFTDYGTMWLPLPVLPIAAALLGVASLWRRDRTTLGFLLAPVLLTLLAAALHRYPFAGRLILFLVPLVIVLIGAGVQAFVGATKSRPQWVARAAVALLLAPTAGLALFYAARRPGREEIKPMLAYVGARRQPGDVLYVFDLSVVPFRYHRDRFGRGPDRFDHGDMPWVAGRRVEPTAAAWAAELSPLRARPRAWVLLTHWAALGGADERPLVTAALGGMGRRLEAHEAKGAMVLLYEMRPGPATMPTTTLSQRD